MRTDGDGRRVRREPRGDEALAAVVVLFAAVGVVICGAAWRQGRAASATTTADVAPVLVGATIDDDVVPGTAVDVVLTVDNPSAAPVLVRRVELVALTVDHEHAACRAEDFSMDGVGVDEVVPPRSSGHRLAVTGALELVARDIAQDECQGATLSLYLAAR